MVAEATSRFGVLIEDVAFRVPMVLVPEMNSLELSVRKLPKNEFKFVKVAFK